MEFVKFLEDVPSTNKRYLAKVYTQNSWLPCIIQYYGPYKGECYITEHLIQDENNCILDPNNVVYIKE